MAGEQLRVTEGEERGKILDVEADLLIGRFAPEPEGRLGGDPKISRRHARVSRGADRRLTIEDLGSANGTFVNDERIDAPRTLEAGDVVRVGRTALQVTEDPAAVSGQPSPSADAGAEAAAAGAPVGDDLAGARADDALAAARADRPHAASAEAGGVLVVTAGNALGRRFVVSDELVIGRAADGDGRLREDLELSRRHARIARDHSGQLTVEDLGSANGTFVNGERVRGRRVLVVGDSVRVGSTTLRVTDLGEARASGPPAAPAVAPAPAAPPAPRRPVARPVAPQPVVPAAGRQLAELELPLGSVLVGCRIEEVINHGEMGVVYRAEELALQRLVALKLILPEYSRDERFRERFRRESKIAAAIDHPNVIPIFDAGDEDGVLYIMMRLVEGTDLRALIAAERQLEPLRAARIVRQVGAALDAAHARGMLHRDVKPSNVLLARRDHVYLTDFGLAKQAASVEGLTRNQTIVARAEYVAPEQILNERVDARADIYALGCLLFEALTGEPPFARWGGGPRALAHVEAPPPSVRDLRPDLPQEFDDVVRRAMAKDPNERYPSGGDLGQAALVAAGGLQQATPWAAVATGEAAIPAEVRSSSVPADAPRAAARAPRAAVPVPRAAEHAPADRVPQRAQAGRSDTLRWLIALAGLVIVAVGMVAALHGISTL